MNRNLFIIALATIGLTSCSTISNTSQIQNVDSKISSMTVADLRVDTVRATKTVNWNWSPFKGIVVSEKEKTAQGELLIEKDADVLVEPTCMVNRRGIFRGGSVTVSGYPAKYYNFRPMTREDAEIIATANGTYMPGAPVVVETSASFNAFHKRDGKRKGLESEEKSGKSNTKFISLLGGPMFDLNGSSDYNTGFNLSIMFGQHWSKWGYYIKGTVVSAVYDSASSYGSSYNERKTTTDFTIGVIKTLNKKNNLFIGVGLGGYMTSEYNMEQDIYYYYDYYGWQHSYYYSTNKEAPVCKLAVPVELGWQWHSDRFNLMIGAKASISTDSDYENFNLAPFVGIGYNF